MKIEIVQYMRPDGRKQPIYSDVPDEVGEKVAAIQNAGFEVSMECLLPTENVALYISDNVKGRDLVIEIVANGPGLPEKFNETMLRFDLDKALLSDDNGRQDDG